MGKFLFLACVISLGCGKTKFFRSAPNGADKAYRSELGNTAKTNKEDVKDDTNVTEYDSNMVNARLKEADGSYGTKLKNLDLESCKSDFPTSVGGWGLLGPQNRLHVDFCSTEAENCKICTPWEQMGGKAKDVRGCKAKAETCDAARPCECVTVKR